MNSVDNALTSVGVFFPATRSTRLEILFVVALALVLVRLPLCGAVPARTTRTTRLVRCVEVRNVNRLALSCDIAVLVLRIQVAENAVVVPEVVEIRKV